MMKYKPSVKDIFLMIFRDALLKNLALFIIYFPISLFLNFILVLLAKEKPLHKESLGVQYDGWRNLQLPTLGGLLFPLGNAQVGIMGDKWWPSNLAGTWLAKIGVTDTNHYLAKWWWVTIRNPTNNILILMGQHVTDKAVIDYCGDYAVDSGGQGAPAAPGWQMVRCTDDGKTTFSFYMIAKYPGINYCFKLRVGYKVKPNVPYVNTLIGPCLVPTPIKKLQ